MLSKMMTLMMENLDLKTPDVPDLLRNNKKTFMNLFLKTPKLQEFFGDF